LAHDGRDRRQKAGCAYLDAAAALRPLAQIDGFISIERFQSLSEPGKLLSLSFWRDEAAVVAQWGGPPAHPAVWPQHGVCRLPAARGRRGARLRHERPGAGARRFTRCAWIVTRIIPFTNPFKSAMNTDLDLLRLRLAGGPQPARALMEALGLSQPTLSRRLAALGPQVVRLGAARSIQYALRDTLRGLPDIPVYRVDTAGQLSRLGLLVPVRSDGFVMHAEAGDTLYSPGLPWWLLDMRPQGYLGRAYVARHGAALGLPARLGDWSDTHALQALLVHGHDAVGNLLLGDTARGQFLAMAAGAPISSGRQARRLCPPGA
jgi:hypothetical protein